MNSEANNSDKEGTWEDKIDLEEIPRKIGQLRMSAEAEEFRPRNMYYGPQGHENGEIRVFLSFF